MKIKRFFAADIRQAIQLVRKELGADAVILSNKKVDGGVEIMAALDYDENALQTTANVAPQQAAINPSQNNHAFSKGLYAKQLETDMYHSDTGFDSINSAPMSAPQQPGFSGSNKGFANDLQKALQKKLNQQQDHNTSPRDEDSVTISKQARKTQVSDKLMSLSNNYENNVRKPVKTEKKPASSIEWSQDPAIIEMKREMESMRKLLENQLSGMAWNNLDQSQPERVDLLKKLTKMGITSRLAHIIVEKTLADSHGENVWKRALQHLSKMLPVHDNELLEKGGVIAFVGPTGVGKTTTIAKLAAKFALAYGSHSVALVTTDCYRIGAHEQLINYGRILDVPVRVASNAEELEEVLYSFSDKRLVLIDTAGMSQRDMKLSEQLSILKVSNMPVRNYLVMSAATHPKALGETIRAFSRIEPEACVLTKVDETANLGGALSEVIRHRMPVAYVTDGQRVPEDIHLAKATSLVKRSVSLMDDFADEDSENAMAMKFGGMALHASI